MRRAATSPHLRPVIAASHTIGRYSGTVASATRATSSGDKRPAGRPGAGSFTPRHGDLAIQSDESANANTARMTPKHRRTDRGCIVLCPRVDERLNIIHVTVPMRRSPSAGRTWTLSCDSSADQVEARFRVHSQPSVSDLPEGQCRVARVDPPPAPCRPRRWWHTSRVRDGCGTWASTNRSPGRNLVELERRRRVLVGPVKFGAIADRGRGRSRAARVGRRVVGDGHPPVRRCSCPM